MATTYNVHSGTELPAAVQEHRVVHSTQTMLRAAYGIIPIVAGLDKFTDFIVQWDKYLNPVILRLIPLSAVTFMHVVGVIEVIAGILLLAKPRIGAPIVAAWLIGIALQLLAGWMFLDIVVRDIWLAIGAIALARLSRLVDEEPATA